MLAVVLLALGALTAGCGSGGRSTQPTPQSGTGPGTEEVQVLAASSLAPVLPALVDGYLGRWPDATVASSTGASNALVEQVRAGAPADVVLTADRATADRAAAALGAAARAPEAVATTTLVVAVPAGNPGEVRTLADLSRPDLLVGLCAAQVPCGGYARRLLRQEGVAAAVDTEEPDARSLMAKVASGDLDAGVVYRVDARAAGAAVSVVEVPSAATVPVTYFAVSNGTRPAAAFVSFLLGPGRGVLTDAGFGVP